MSLCTCKRCRCYFANLNTAACPACVSTLECELAATQQMLIEGAERELQLAQRVVEQAYELVALRAGPKT